MCRTYAITLVAAGCVGVVGACSDPAVIDIEVTTGKEDGALSLDPAITVVEISAINPEGEVVLLASAAPGEAFDMGDAPDTTILSFELTGKTADGTVEARGRSVSIAIGALDPGTGVLPLFIQRLESFARPPGSLERAHVHAPGGVLAETILIATGGDSAFGDDGEVDASHGDYYDLLTLQGFVSPKLPRAARSMVVRGGSVLYLIDDDGASVVDLDSGADAGEVAAPEGFEFAEVSGGLAIDAANGLTFVVGATRPEDPTDAVFVFDPQGAVSAVRLATPRAGAAALYVEEVGLVIAGGSPDGPGVEVVQDDGVTVSSIPFLADPTTGAAAVTEDNQKITLFGGRIDGAAADTRVLDLRCIGEECLDATGLQPSLTFFPEIWARGVAFKIEPGHTIVVGEQEDGETVAFLASYDEVGVEEVEQLVLRVPRKGATAIAAPNGTLAIVGGVTTATGGPAGSVELLFPELRVEGGPR